MCQWPPRSYLDWREVAVPESTSVKEPIILKLAKHAVAIAVVVAAAGAPVAARAEVPSFNFTHVSVTNSVQASDASDAGRPR
jgi:hypothetical protein